MLHLHRAERADHLVGELAAVLREPLADPFQRDVLAVPTRGVERWLSQQLARTLGASGVAGTADGVCANVAFPFPGTVVAEAVAATARAGGLDGGGIDAWAPERAVWPLLEVVEHHLGDAWLKALAAHVAGGGPGDGSVRLFGTVRRLSDLFDRYAFHRPAMVDAWRRGDDVDGRGEPLGDQRWQAELWRRLRARIDRPSPAEELPGACAALRVDPTVVDLPPRLGLFGLTRLPPGYLDVLDALAAHRDVHLFLLHPSPALWAEVAAALVPDPDAPRPPPATWSRRSDPTASVTRHPLLRSWGRDTREMQVLLSGTSAPVEDLATPGRESRNEMSQDSGGGRRAGGAEPATLLARLQADLHADRSPPGRGRPGADDRLVLDPSDRSIQVHACHGSARQVEVLRDAILHLLAADPTLQPRDIVVMCPDIDAFTPLIHAAFGAGAVAEDEDADGADGDPASAAATAFDAGPVLTVRLADRSLRQSNPVLAAVSELLAFVGGRFPASAVLDFADREPVRRRFDLDDDDLGRIEEWVASAGIRWGIDAEHRKPFKLDGVRSNTWRAGLDRILLGVVMTEQDLDLVGGVLPIDDVDSGDIDRAGRLAELVTRLGDAVDALTDPKPIAGWAEALRHAADALTLTSDTDRWQRVQLEQLLHDVVTEAGGATDPGAASPVLLGVDDIRTLLADRLRGQPTRANFRTGHLTMCTLVPMRSVPHRVVCLLGLDDGVFPRRTATDGDDLIERDPCVGDPDPRSEDRQLLLDALLATTEHLVVTYQARDERTNHVRPPAVPLGELLDVIDQTACVRPAGDGTPRDGRSQVVVEHPLQPHDARNFVAGRLGAPGAWSFDRNALAGAVAATGPKVVPGPFLTGPLPPLEDDVIELDRLVQFVQHPVKAFLRLRLGLSFFEGDDDTSDALPIVLDALGQWGVGQRLLDHRLAGADEETCRQAELARGLLPPDAFGHAVLDEVEPKVRSLLSLVEKLGPVDGDRRAYSVAETLPDGRLLVGTVPLVTGQQLRSVTFSSLSARHRLTAWVQWLALTLAHPEEPFEALTVGRSGRRARVATINAPSDTDGDPAARRAFAEARLVELVDLYDRGMRAPLPIFPRTSAAYADGVWRRVDDPGGAATKEWASGDWEKEDRDAVHVLVLGGVVPLRTLLNEDPSTDADAWDDSWPDELSRFGGYSRRLWDPLLAVERTEVR